MTGSKHHPRTGPADPVEPAFIPRLVRRDPTRLTRLEVNARYMTKEEYDRLVGNVRRDGCLTSVPLIYGGGIYPEGEELIVSGNHRCNAAVDVGLPEVDAMLIDTPLTEQQLIALQLSHNAIAGHDDPATLRQLYERLDEVDWRTYSGLDDNQLELLAKVDMEGLAEANLDFLTVQVVFLPPELDAARKALEGARAGADQTWLAARADYDATLDALASAHQSHRVGNIATALAIVLAVFEQHLTDLQDGYQDEDGEATRAGAVPIETMFGTRTVPVETATAYNRAVARAAKAGDIAKGDAWGLLQRLADAYVAGLDADESARRGGLA